jgi:ATP-dependent Clp protease ATP-binding subunit ClpA
MFERFTEGARDVVAGAERHAAALRHGHIGTEHLLLALTDHPDSRPARVLATVGITGPWARAEVVRRVGRGEPGLDADALATLGIDLGAIRERVEKAFGPGALDRRPGRRRKRTGYGGQRPFTPAAKKALELSLREAIALGDRSIGPEHILLGIAREGNGVGSGILVEEGLTYGMVRDALQRDEAA